MNNKFIKIINLGLFVLSYFSHVSSQDFPVNEYRNHWKYPDPMKNAEVIVPDFQVNENAGPGGAEQSQPAIAAEYQGNFVVAWVDRRNGDSDIYAQYYSTGGKAVRGNFKVNDDEGSKSQVAPCIAMDENGNFIIAWEDDRNDGWNIYIQRYSSDGVKIGTNFKVDDLEGSVHTFSMAANETGNFVLTWENYHNEEYDIYAQRFSSNGTAIGRNFKVNDDIGDEMQMRPDVGITRSGDFVIVWEDSRDENPGIYAQRYSSDGTKIGSNFKVADDECGNPAIEMAGNGNFVITWNDFYNVERGIYAQLYSSHGTAIGSNIKVTDGHQNTNSNYPAIAIDGAGNFVITWIDDRNFEWKWDVYAQRYTNDGLAVGSNFQINELDGFAMEIRPSVVMDWDGNFYIAWGDKRNRDLDIYVQRFSNHGAQMGDNVKVNDDFGSANQYSPSITVDESGNFLISWLDARTDKPGIYAKRFSQDGTAIGSTFMVNSKVGYLPLTAMDSSGNFVISWREGNNPFENWDVYAQRFSRNGTAIGSKFKINTVGNSVLVAAPLRHSISMNGHGDFVISWCDTRNFNSYGLDIYAQRFSTHGARQGTNFKVNDDVGDESQSAPWIAMNRNGDFVITWVDGRNWINSRYDIYVQRYSSDGMEQGSNFKVNDDNGKNDQTNPCLSIDGNGNFIVTWVDSRNSRWDIYAQRYSKDGTALGDNFKVNDIEMAINPSHPKISCDESGNYVIIWQSRFEVNEDYDIYAKCYSFNDSAYGNQFLVTNTSKMKQHSPDVKMHNNRIYATWMDNRAGGSGFDIWANVLDWQRVLGVAIREPHQTPGEFILHQNYPNPFNSETTIPFSILNSNFISLKIYNIQGKEIETLVNSELFAGDYRIKFKANNIPSGIYFYRLKAGGFTQTKKFILQK